MLNNQLLKRFWFRFDDSPLELPISLGVGLTAYNYDDAINILQEKIFTDASIPDIISVVKDIDISILDAGHVLLNMSPPNIRGVWFPLGYSQWST